jgi:ribosomal protein S18 acetylase RimI-like enzyme
MMAPIVKTATASDEASVIDVLTLAFCLDPLARWGWPDPREYLMYAGSFLWAFGGKAFAHGSAYYVEGYRGAALWLPPGVQYDEEGLVSLIQRTAPEEMQKDVVAVWEQAARHHPSEPHWYLPVIGIDLFYQGKGYGSALMQRALIPCDRDKKIAYLEASTEEAIPFYERHGFEVLSRIKVGASPTIVPMLRTPR